jgi:hypothetical protein
MLRALDSSNATLDIGFPICDRYVCPQLVQGFGKTNGFVRIGDRQQHVLAGENAIRAALRVREAQGQAIAKKVGTGDLPETFPPSMNLD